MYTPEQALEDYRACNLTVADWHKHLRHTGLTLPQYVVLVTLRSGNSLSVGAIAGNLGITRGNMTGICDRLENDGLITRERSASDRRVVSVALTPAGASVLEKAALAAVS